MGKYNFVYEIFCNGYFVTYLFGILFPMFFTGSKSSAGSNPTRTKRESYGIPKEYTSFKGKIINQVLKIQKMEARLRFKTI